MQAKTKRQLIIFIGLLLFSITEVLIIFWPFQTVVALLSLTLVFILFVALQCLAHDLYPDKD